MLLPIQHFIAYHTLTSEVQSLLTKPQFDSLALTLIQPQNSKAKPKSWYYCTLLKQFSYHFLSLYLRLRNFLDYLECATFGF